LLTSGGEPKISVLIVLCFSFIALTHLLEEWNFVHFIRLGFWNVTNPRKNERRKSTKFSTLFCKNSSCHSYNYDEKVNILTISFSMSSFPIHKDKQRSWSSVLDGSWINCTSKIQ
jgi:hypothetical protein